MKILPTIAILCLSVLLLVPSTMPRAHAVLSNGDSYWSPFGTRVENLLFKVYADFPPMFTDFNAGQLDVADWQIQPADLTSYIANPDFFVTSPQGDFGIFEIDHNSHNPFLTIALQTARATGTVSLVIGSTVACGVTCPSNTFQLVVTVNNNEEGSAAVKDVNNFVTATITGASSPTASKADDANPAPAGTYTLPPLSNVPASYKIATTIYGGSVTLFTSGSTNPVCPANSKCTGTLNVNYNSPSTMKPTSAGIYIARAISHMLDKPSYLTGSYLSTPGGSVLANCLDVFAPAAQGLMTGAGACDHNSAPLQSGTTAPNPPSSGPATINGELTDHAWFSGTPVSLYNLTPDDCIGTVTASCPVPGQSGLPFTAHGYSGPDDLRAACDYFVLAGFGLTAGDTCATLAASGYSATHHIVNPSGSCNTGTGVGCVGHYPRTSNPRRAYGAILGDTLNYLFGTPATSGGGTVCYGGPPNFSCSLTPKYFTIGQITSTIFGDGVVPDTWNLYTGGYGLGSTPDQLWSLDHSQFASTYCGGAKSSFPNNYGIYCDPAFDGQATAGEFGIGNAAFQAAAALGATRGERISVFSAVNQYVALNGWNTQPGTSSSIVSVKGHGLAAAYSYFPNVNMHATGSAPTNSLYWAGGCDPSTGCEPDTIRRSMAQTTLHMSPYTALTVWEFDPLIQIYDSMLSTDPQTSGLCQTQPGGTNHCIDWMTTSHLATYDAPTNHLTQTWNLRSDIYWHDGQPVTAQDVCFTVLSYKDAPNSNALSSVSNVVSCMAVSNNIVQVVLTGNSPFSELNIGGQAIIPGHVWASANGAGGVWPPSPGTGVAWATTAAMLPGITASKLADPAFDPFAAGIMVGSSAFICNPSVGVSTIAGQASCTQNADGSAGGQAVGAGGRILLKANLGYMRSTPDAQGGSGKVSGGVLKTSDLQAMEWADQDKDGKVTTIDIATAATVFGSTDPYFAHSLYGVSCSPCTVDIADIATMASFIDHGITSPFIGTPTGAHKASPNGALAVPPGANPGIDPRTDPYTFTDGTGTYLLQDAGFTGSARISRVGGGTPGVIACGSGGIACSYYKDTGLSGQTPGIIPGAAFDGGGHANCTPAPATPCDDVLVTINGSPAFFVERAVLVGGIWVFVG